MYQDIKEKFNDIERKLSLPETMNDQKAFIQLSQERAQLKNTIELILKLEKIEKDLKENHEIIKNENDAELIKIAEEELSQLEEEKKKISSDIELALKPVDPNDIKTAIVEIRGGAGGDESALFAADLFRMYSRYAEHKGWKIELLNTNRIGIGGFKEVIFEVKGKGAYGDLKFEAGTHRVQRVPETEKQGRVHTSTATVAVLPEAEEVDLEINPNDIRIDTFCSSGPGGQSVNTTYSAIRITHLPTGTVVSCQDQKSQHQNKEKAMQILRSRLLQKAEEERQAKESEQRKSQFGKGERSDKIRTYNFPQDRVTDHRIGQTWHSIDRIMDGGIEEMILELKKAS